MNARKRSSAETTRMAELEHANENGQLATPEDLKKFIKRVDAESIRLSASGTTDPIVNARVVELAKMKSDVETILMQVEANTLPAAGIPIMKSDVDKAYPILGKPSDPLPNLIKTYGLSPELANLLPPNLQKDPETTREINRLVDKYMDTIVNGVSASFNVKYTSPREAKKGSNNNCSMEKGHLLSSTIDKTCLLYTSPSPRD